MYKVRKKIALFVGVLMIISSAMSLFGVLEVEAKPLEPELISDVVISFAPDETWEALPGRTANPNNLFKDNDNNNGKIVSVAVDDTFGRNDSYSLKVTRTGPTLGDDGWLHWVRMGHIAEWATPGDEQLALPQGSYAISAWFYVPSEAAEGKDIAGPQMFLNNTGASYPSSGGSIETDKWVEVSFETPEMSVNLDSITFMLSANGNVDRYPTHWYIDDISIVQLSAVAPEPPKWDLSMASIKDTYKDYFIMGTIIGNPDLLGEEDNDMTTMYKHHYNVLTAENANKPGYLVTADGEYRLDQINKMADWSRENGFDYVGHTLVWHSQSSEYLHGTVEEPLTRDVAQARMQDFINEVAGSGANSIKGKVLSWDVVNEAFTPGVGSYSGDWKAHLRTGTGSDPSPWYAAYANGADTAAGESGADFIYDAFVFTRLADPDATLYYNDFNDEEVGKSHAIAAMVKDLNNQWKSDPRNEDPERLLIEGIGLQSHYNTTLSMKSVETAIQHYLNENPGIKLSVTELDITIAGTDETIKPTEEQYIEQALMYAEVFEIYKRYADVIERVTFWGTDDGTSWRSFGQNGGTGGYPTIFTNDYKAKEAFSAVIDPEAYLAAHAPASVEIKTGEAAYTQEAPALDGTSKIWDTAAPLTVNTKAAGDSPATAQAWLLWDNDNLYMRIAVKDANIDVSAENDWEKDSVELYLSQENFRGEYNEAEGNQYRITANGLRSQKSGSPDDWSGFAQLTDDGYIVECALPWSETPAKQGVIGLDIQINDPPPADGSRPQVTWSDPNANGYNSSEYWGEITLVQAEVESITPEVPVIEDSNTDGSNTWIIILVIAIVALAGAGGYVLYKRKK